MDPSRSLPLLLPVNCGFRKDSWDHGHVFSAPHQFIDSVGSWSLGRIDSPSGANVAAIRVYKNVLACTLSICLDQLEVGLREVPGRGIG